MVELEFFICELSVLFLLFKRVRLSDDDFDVGLSKRKVKKLRFFDLDSELDSDIILFIFAKILVSSNIILIFEVFFDVVFNDENDDDDIYLMQVDYFIVESLENKRYSWLMVYYKYLFIFLFGFYKEKNRFQYVCQVKIIF